jgi:hypothetical protein
MVLEWLDISIGGMFVFVPPLQQHQTQMASPTLLPIQSRGSLRPF